MFHWIFIAATTLFGLKKNIRFDQGSVGLNYVGDNVSDNIGDKNGQICHQKFEPFTVDFPTFELHVCRTL